MSKLITILLTIIGYIGLIVLLIVPIHYLVIKQVIVTYTLHTGTVVDLFCVLFSMVFLLVLDGIGLYTIIRYLRNNVKIRASIKIRETHNNGGVCYD